MTPLCVSTMWTSNEVKGCASLRAGWSWVCLLVELGLVVSFGCMSLGQTKPTAQSGVPHVCPPPVIGPDEARRSAQAWGAWTGIGENAKVELLSGAVGRFFGSQYIVSSRDGRYEVSVDPYTGCCESWTDKVIEAQVSELRRTTPMSLSAAERERIEREEAFPRYRFLDPQRIERLPGHGWAQLVGESVVFLPVVVGCGIDPRDHKIYRVTSRFSPLKVGPWPRVTEEYCERAAIDLVKQVAGDSSPTVQKEYGGLYSWL